MDDHLPVDRFRTTVALVLGFAACAGWLASSASCGSQAPAPSSEDSAFRPTPTGGLAQAPDGGYDARVPPAPRDASVTDAQDWDGSIPFPGDWGPIDGLPPNCPARIGLTPALSVPKFDWKPCISGRRECEHFTADWGPPSHFLFFPNRIRAAFEDAKGVHIAFARLVSGLPYHVTVVQELHGAAELVAFGTLGPLSCYPSKVSISKQGFGLVITQSVNSLLETYATWGALGDTAPARAVRVTDQIGGPSTGVQAMTRGDGFLTFEQARGTAINATAFRLSTNTVIPAVPDLSIDSGRPIATSGGYFARVSGDPRTIVFVPLDGPVRTVIRPLPGNHIYTFDLDRENGDALAWSEGGGSSESPAVLYTAPFATSEAALVRRAVARVPNAFSLLYNRGMVAIQGTYAHMRLVRVADGMGWDVPTEANIAMMNPLWVNDEYVWTYISGIPQGMPGFPVLGGAIRIRRDTLGPPTIPPGL